MSDSGAVRRQDSMSKQLKRRPITDVLPTPSPSDWAAGEAAGAGATLGAVLGSMVRGKWGALIGGAAGGALGVLLLGKKNAAR